MLVIVNSTSQEIGEIRVILESKFKSKFSYTEFLDLYYKNAKLIVNDVNFFGLGIEQTYKKPRIQIDKIFIKPDFNYRFQNSEKDLLVKSYKADTEEDDDKHCQLKSKSLLIIEENCIILGKPGAGKSLFIKAIIYSIINKDHEILECENIFNYLPIRIELRKYLSYKRANNKNITNYILVLLEVEYGINFLDLDDVKFILKKENVLMLFDGLDEIFNISEKNEVRNDIIIFTNSNKVRTIVTSRFKGYEDAKFDEHYLEFEMMDFNDDQINEYIYINGILSKKIMKLSGKMRLKNLKKLKVLYRES